MTHFIFAGNTFLSTQFGQSEASVSSKTNRLLSSPFIRAQVEFPAAAMRCHRVFLSKLPLSGKRSQVTSSAFSSQLQWSSPRAPTRESFKQFYWDEENVLYLYAIQRVQLVPNVKEDVKFLGYYITARVQDTTSPGFLVQVGSGLQLSFF